MLDALMAAFPPAPPAFTRAPGPVWVRHLNCATNEPLGGGLLTGEGGWLGRARIVCHVLVVGTPRGLLLVDTGLGTRDVAAPEGRFLGLYRWLLAPRLAPEETAIARLRRMGFGPEAVTDVALTHLDLDHTGGLADFPGARIHVLAPERGRHAGSSAVARLARARYAHGPRWAPHVAGPDRWFGFAAARLPIAGADVRLVALPGHSPGHAGVAIRQGDRWLLHAGDAYMFRRELEGAGSTPGLALFRALRPEDGPTQARTLKGLKRLVTRPGGRVTVFCAHDGGELATFEAAEATFAAVRAGATSSGSPASPGCP